MSKFIFLLAVISFSAVCGFFVGQQSNSSASSATIDAENRKKPDFIKVLEAEKIIKFQSWENEKGVKFIGVVRHLSEPCDKDYGLDSCQKLFIYDDVGKTVYEKSDFGIDFKIQNLTRKDFQIVMTTNSGGTDNFLEIVDYQNGKFIEIIESSETQMRGGWWNMNEYRSGMKTPDFKPSQIFVTQQVGGADPNPSASVFRFKDEKYQRIGEIKMQELGDFIEKQIAKNSSK